MTVEQFQDEVGNLLVASCMWTDEDREIAAEIIKAMRGDEEARCHKSLGVIIAAERRFLQNFPHQTARPAV